MGFEAQSIYRISSPLCGSVTASNSAIGGMSASSFSAKAVVNYSAAASASSMIADAASASASLGTTYPDDTFWRSLI